MLALTSTLPMLNCLCNNVRIEGLIQYETNKLVLVEEGEVVIPIVLDLHERISVCNQMVTISVLDDLLRSHISHIQPARKVRHKRFIGALLLGIGAAATAWNMYDNGVLHREINRLRNEFNNQTGYVARLMDEAQSENANNFIAIRRNINDYVTAIRADICGTSLKQVEMFLQHYQMFEFDDIISSIHSRVLTSKIIPPDQLSSLVSMVPILKQSIYDTMPYLLYYCSKIQFDLRSVSNGLLKGTLHIPLIHKYERVHIHYISKLLGSDLRIFGPTLVTSESNLDVSSCEDDADIIICKFHEMKSPKYDIIMEDYSTISGLVAVNSGIPAMLRLHGNTIDIRAMGPFICSYNDTVSVRINDYCIYNHASVGYIAHPSISLSNMSYNYTLNLKNFAITDIKNFEQILDHHVFSGNTLSGNTFFGIMLFLLIVMSIFLYYYIRHRCNLCKLKAASIVPLERVEVLKCIAPQIPSSPINIPRTNGSRKSSLRFHASHKSPHNSLKGECLELTPYRGCSEDVM